MKTFEKYIIEKMQEVLSVFPHLKLCYQVDDYDDTYIIEVIPRKELNSNIELQDHIKNIYIDAFEKYPYNAVGFVDDNSLFELDKPITELKRYMYEYIEKQLAEDTYILKEINQKSVILESEGVYTFAA